MGWNKPSQPQPGDRLGKGLGRRGNAAVIRGLVALGVAAVCAAVAWMVADCGRGQRPIPDLPSTPRATGGPSRARAQGQMPDGSQRQQTSVPGKAPGYGSAPPDGGTQAVTRAGVAATNAEIQARLERFEKEPVKGLAEQLLMMVVPPKKGEIVPPPPIDVAASPEIEREAQAMLERQGVVEDWDDDDSIAIKERLESLKDEWYAFKRDGGSFHEFLRKRLDKSNFDAETLEEARRFDSENYHDQSLSDDEYRHLHGKVNRLLEIQGFDKIESPNDEPSIEEERE